MLPPSMPQLDTVEVQSLADLTARIVQQPAMAEVMAALARGESGTIDGAWGSSCALAAGALAKYTPTTLLIVLPRVQDVDDFAADLAWYVDEPPVVFSAWEGLPAERSLSDAVFGARLRVLEALDAPPPPKVIVTSMPALLQPVPPRSEREAGVRRIATGDEIDVDELLRWLVERGFERTSAIEEPGQFSVHGGIIDIFAPAAEDPLRIELFGDEVDSLRSFDVETQRKVSDLDRVRITAIAPAKSDEDGDDSPSEYFTGNLPPNARIALVEPEELVSEGRHYLERLDEPRGLFQVPEVLSRLTEFPSVTVAALSGASVETTCHLQVESIERFAGPRSEVFEELAGILSPLERVLIACHNEGEQERLSELLANEPENLQQRVALCIGTVTSGFRLVAEQLVVVSDHELFGRVDIRRLPRRRRRMEGRAIDSFLELSPGDLVVHLAHGIGRFRGMQFQEKEGRREEHLVIEFRDGVKVYVPVSLIHLVQKYVGAAKGATTLSKLGGVQWNRQKQRVAAAVSDMASDMLQIQAERQSRPGIACPADTHLQQEFEASFPYVETDDQLHAIEDAKRDLEETRPMDRLICGDVGFGKTEVALRAAFKVVDSGRQVAVLVPTTVLAEQHYRTFCDRLAEYPITVEVLSRFRSKGEQRKILERMEAGRVDIVIGTHRLIQPDVYFRDLGLLIVDEEQRFGVAAKEMLKRLRLSVDVLTMTATPIPRTLHMSLLGIRDISNLTTAPQDRMAIETRVGRWDANQIRHAVVRELNRGGQVYFVHNRVYNIRSIADRLQKIIPEARIGIVHGQMPEHELETNMLDFVRGRTDILVATTIIESGLDIPNANTMFIHQADKYGLADLHQLRGRVGRYKHRAYCYLIVEEGRILTSVAAKRLKAIEEFSELGGGFRIAMRDLEIRGAGNILGTEQSGHIAAVGYELYCQLLENAVLQLKGEAPRETPQVHVDLPIEAYFPNDYVPPGRQKIDVYRKVSATADFDALAELEEELRDRFGPLPEPAENLIAIRRLQLAAHGWKIRHIRMEEGYALFDYRDPARIRELANRLSGSLRVADSKSAYLVLPNRPIPGPELAAHIESVLR